MPHRTPRPNGAPLEPEPGGNGGNVLRPGVGGQSLRYLVVGGVNTVVGYASFAALYALLAGKVPAAYIFANLLANVVAITVAFFGYKYFVFRTRGDGWREYFRTYVVYGTSMLVGLALLPLMVQVLSPMMKRVDLVPYIAQALTMLLVVGGSFFGHRNYSFRR